MMISDFRANGSSSSHQSKRRRKAPRRPGARSRSSAGWSSSGWRPIFEKLEDRNLLAADVRVLDSSVLTIDEGSQADLRLAISDTDSGGFAVVVNWGDGSDNTRLDLGGANGRDGSQTRTRHPYGDNGDYTITIDVTNTSTGQTTRVTDAATVANVAPTVTNLSATAISGGGEVTLSGKILDPGTQDTFELTIDWKDGNVETLAAGTSFSFRHTYDLQMDSPPFQVEVTAKDDDDGTSGTASLTVAGRPTLLRDVLVDGGLETEIDEGGSVVLTGTVVEGPVDLRIDWNGDGDFDDADETMTDQQAGAFSFTHDYPDDDPSNTASDTYAVLVELTDPADNTVNAATVEVTVNNLDPTDLRISATDQDINGNTTLSGTFSDVGVDDTFTIDVKWGDDTTDTVTVTDGSFSVGHDFVDASQAYAVSVSVTDDDGGQTGGTTRAAGNTQAAALLRNVRVDGGDRGFVDESQAVQVTGTVAAAGTLEFDWDGDGTTDETIDNQPAGDFSVPHLYPDDVPSNTSFDDFELAVTFTSGANTVTQKLPIRVMNLDPAIISLEVNDVLVADADGSVNSVEINEGETVTLDLVFTDPALADSHDVSIVWGDGSSTTISVPPVDPVICTEPNPEDCPPDPGVVRQISTTHVYADDNVDGTSSDVYTILIDVVDDDTGLDNVSVDVAVNNLPPTANDDAVDADEDGPAVTINVLANDTDPAGAADPLTVTGVDTTGTIGSVSFTAGDVTYDPNGQFEELDDGDFSTDTFGYSITDGDLGTADAIVTVTIRGQNDAPEAVDDIASTDEDTPVTVDVLANDTDVDGDDNPSNFSLDSIDAVTVSRLTIDPDLVTGSVTIVGKQLAFDPATDFDELAVGELAVGEMATVSVDYTMSDDSGAGSSSVAVITVEGVNDAPEITALGSTSSAGTKVNEGDRVDVSGTFFDLDISDTHTATVDWGDGAIGAIGALDVTDTGQTGAFTSANGSGHAYSEGGIFVVTVTVDDGNGGVVTETTEVFIVGSRIEGRVLHVVGTNDGDTVSFNKSGGNSIKVHTDFFPERNFRTYSLAAIDSILIKLCDGDDHLNIAGNIDSSDAVILVDGGPGDDFLQGGKGPDVLIGGGDGDELKGKKGGDVLIGGTTAQDGDHLALLAVLDAWTSDESYEDRVSDVDALLTVVDDGDSDILKGDQGRDLFYDGVGDNLIGLAGNETVLGGSGSGEGAARTEEAQALTLIIATESITEVGKTTATLIRSNTDLSSPLDVHLESTDPGEAAVADMVTIPIGVNSVNVEVAGVDDGAIDGNKMIVIVASAEGFETGSDTVEVAEDNFPYHNELLAADVDKNGIVTPRDVLLVVNQLNANGARYLADEPVDHDSPLSLVDSSRDNFVSPFDALLIVNFLNRLIGDAEGEQSVVEVRSDRLADSKTHTRAPMLIAPPSALVTTPIVARMRTVAVESMPRASRPVDLPRVQPEAMQERLVPAFDALDPGDLDGALSELAEDLVSARQPTARDLFFAQ